MSATERLDAIEDDLDRRGYHPYKDTTYALVAALRAVLAEAEKWNAEANETFAVEADTGAGWYEASLMQHASALVIAAIESALDGAS